MLHSNVIYAPVMSKLSVTGFLLHDLPLLYLSRFEPNSDCLRESHFVLADDVVIPDVPRSIFMLVMTPEREIIWKT